ncbi:hypothetical protein [Haliscomenobacter sp.]|uniref:hypothetical protein n=1 Tax=Haliscomenobacter sp. TaxID=2717303 RepID=UPI003592F84B
MENTEILDEFQNPSSNEESTLHIHKDMYGYLNTAARWGNILAIIGFVLTGIGALFGLLGLVAIGAAASSAELAMLKGLPTLMWVALLAYFAILGLYILPLLYLSRFASNLKTALYADNQDNLAISFENLGKLFKFLGILTLVVIGVHIILYGVMMSITLSAVNSLQNF